MDPSAVTWARSDSFPGSVKLPAAPTAPAPLPLPYQAERVPRALPTNVSSSVPSLYSQIPPSSSFGVATGPTQILTDKGALDDQYYHHLFSNQNGGGGDKSGSVGGLGGPNSALLVRAESPVPPLWSDSRTADGPSAPLQGDGVVEQLASSQAAAGNRWEAALGRKRLQTDRTGEGGGVNGTSLTGLHKMSEAVGLLHRINHPSKPSEGVELRACTGATTPDGRPQAQTRRAATGTGADGEAAQLRADMEHVEISLRAIAHDFSTLFVDAQAQVHALNEAEGMRQVHEQRLAVASAQLDDMDDQVTAARATIDSLRAENLALRRRNQELLELKDAAAIPKVMETLHSEIGALRVQKQAEEQAEAHKAELQRAVKDVANWKAIAEDEMQAHLSAVNEKRELETELRGLREYCQSRWGAASLHGGGGGGRSSVFGGSGGGGGGECMHHVTISTGSGMQTVLVCMCVSVYIHTDRQTDRQTDIQTYIHTYICMMI